jgi:hypothetical protein
VFPSLDPLEDDNRYAWVQGNVINRVDPSGMIDETPGLWDKCFQQEPNCSCLKDTHLRALCESGQSEQSPCSIEGQSPSQTPAPTANPNCVLQSQFLNKNSYRSIATQLFNCVRATHLYGTVKNEFDVNLSLSGNQYTVQATANVPLQALGLWIKIFAEQYHYAKENDIGLILDVSKGRTVTKKEVNDSYQSSELLGMAFGIGQGNQIIYQMISPILLGNTLIIGQFGCDKSPDVGACLALKFAQSVEDTYPGDQGNLTPSVYSLAPFDPQKVFGKLNSNIQVA